MSTADSMSGNIVVHDHLGNAASWRWHESYGYYHLVVLVCHEVRCVQRGGLIGPPCMMNYTASQPLPSMPNPQYLALCPTPRILQVTG